MADTIDFSKNLETFVKLQEDFIKKATETNKKVAVEALRTAKRLNETFAQNIDEQIRRLES
jgi:hypothetical protein